MAGDNHTDKTPPLSTQVDKQKEKQMAKKLFIAQEKWNTRFGKSDRVVVRDANGHFVDNKSKRQIKNGEELGYTVTR